MKSSLYFLFTALILGWGIDGLHAKELPFKYGEYELTSKDQNEICPQGNFQMMGSDDDGVLILGPTIFFPKPGGGSQTERPEKDGCEYKIVTKLQKNSLTKTTSVSLCPEKKFNTVITETLTQVSADQLEYHLKSKNEDGPVDMKCVLKKIKDAAKADE